MLHEHQPDSRLPDWPRACAGPAGQALLKHAAEDFRVEEQLGFAPEGRGQFLWLWVEKQGANTDWVASLLARLAKLGREQVSYAGLKDRHAITRQWFCLPLAEGAELDLSSLDPAEARVLRQSRHPQRLRRGEHQANRFLIRLRQFSGNRELAEQILRQIGQQGFPNYFGEQRFGRDNANLSAAWRWFNGEIRPQRKEQGFYLSAARAYLFNRVLARRVEQGCWQRPLAGDLLQVAASGQYFPIAQPDAGLVERCVQGELCPTGPLYGGGEPRPRLEAETLEAGVLAEQALWTQGLKRQRLATERRALRCQAQGLSWDWQGDDLQLSFGLPPGSFATALLRELVAWPAESGALL
jgi:tRNA pseudouridine13 synthase